ncbi:hypothetical protein K435DRAFT_791120 [Dendrothele bispora CBS 962.96]|uniref:Uncharacterized protein n=1 Tax=Dendrothele bispora (strain CBS 962.96) TaxID=1314807 RepID=A0A4S8MMS4_DENBC|nr:hypothetical protein K435DRAFT_791120 [Dendrothele bispora CBS 962.96]
MTSPPPPSPPSPAANPRGSNEPELVHYWERRSEEGGVYDKMINMDLAMGDEGLGQLEAGSSIILGHHFDNHQKYVKPNNKPIHVQLVGEFVAGTKVHPTGNHSPPPNKFEAIHDKSRIKFNWTLRCPEGAPEPLVTLFHNQVSTLFFAIHSDDRHARKHWVTHTLPDDESDLIHFSTPNIFQPNSSGTAPDEKKMQKRPLNRKSSAVSSSSSTTMSSQDNGETNMPTRKVGETYPPSVMPGYGGPWFDFSSAARLVQLDITDPSGRVIPPWEWYKWIAEGSLAYLTAEMYVYEIKGRKYYTLGMKSLQILDKGDLTPIRPGIRHLESTVSTPPPAEEEPSTATLPLVSPGKIIFTPTLVQKGKQKIVPDPTIVDTPTRVSKRKQPIDAVEADTSKTKKPKPNK